MRSWIGVLVVTIMLGGSAGFAEPLPREQVPEPLRPWIDWVLRGHEDEACPFFEMADRRQCVWPSRLSLELEEKGGTLTQEWRAYRRVLHPPLGPPRGRTGGRFTSELSEGDVFGEIGLLEGATREASVTVVSAETSLLRARTHGNRSPSHTTPRWPRVPPSVQNGGACACPFR